MSTVTEFPIEDILRGDRRTVARAVTALENGDERIHDIRSAIAGHVGRAQVVGVTGPPGGGKSTLISVLIKEFRSRGLKVAVIAVDPSSPFTGGAVLGDRIRMGETQGDEGVFIRSLASRGHLGGLNIAAADVIDLFDAAGFDVLIVETVGSGQAEVEITRYADTRLVICPPGLGDDIQAIKAGILEIADAFVVTKADLPDSARTESQLRAMLTLRTDKTIVPPVMKTVASTGERIPELVDWICSREKTGTRHQSGSAQSVRKLLSRLIQADGFAQQLGLELIAASQGSATVRMRVQDMHINFNGRCHGGAIFSLGDTALGLACNSYGQIATLVDGQLSITSAVEPGEWLVAHAFEVSRSRKIGSYRVNVTRAKNGGHVAGLHGTVYLLDKSLPAEGT
ncbi:AAA domain-containing protein [Thauera humireducens]|jgi:LAO/AO transport system ATPase|uniref:methylmalonyl Co-A mutase-associated GTPase MeaB n=1 Tax=Thauera humireducens TaxID=1134435 RepID=UPI002467A0FE|nr:methylmalonyl Co-A mutase-associated GTPase MeaB [Thauera humireducens]CAH1748660.1 AAA domain-containing protein [Thauera humireducens]